MFLCHILFLQYAYCLYCNIIRTFNWLFQVLVIKCVLAKKFEFVVSGFRFLKVKASKHCLRVHITLGVKINLRQVCFEISYKQYITINIQIHISWYLLWCTTKKVLRLRVIKRIIRRKWSRKWLGAIKRIIRRKYVRRFQGRRGRWRRYIGEVRSWGRPQLIVHEFRRGRVGEEEMSKSVVVRFFCRGL